MLNFKFGRKPSDDETIPADAEQDTDGAAADSEDEFIEEKPYEPDPDDAVDTVNSVDADVPDDADDPIDAVNPVDPVNLGEENPINSADPDSGADASETDGSAGNRRRRAESRGPEQAKPFDYEAEYGFETDERDDDIRSGVFINSLDELEEDDIPLSETAREAERTSAFEVVRRVMFWGFLAAFLVSSFLLIRNLVQKQQAAKIYQDIQAEFFSTGFSFDVSEAFRTDRSRTPGLEEDREQRTIRTMTELLDGAENDADLFPVEELSAESRVVNEDLERKRAFLQNMIRQNADVYAYIVVPNTGISYPVCRGKDNEYYLNHAVTGEYNPVGCVFADYRCESSITRNFNTVFYGHNIENTAVSMFHDVTLFFQKDYFTSTYIYVYTMDGLYIYEPFAVYEAAYDDEYFRVSFTSAEDFIAFAEEAQALSTAKDPISFQPLSKNIEFTERDRILTLSTCTNGYYTQRYALHAKLIRTILE